MDAALVVAGGNATMVDRAREFLEGVTTWEGRVAVSVAMVLLTLLVAIVLAPRLLRGFGRSLLGRFAGERAARSTELLGDAVPTTLGDVPSRLRATGPGHRWGITLFVVWGVFEVAWHALLVPGLSIPLLANFTLTVAIFGSGVVGSDLLVERIARCGEQVDRLTEHQEEILLRTAQLGILALVVSGALTVWGVDRLDLLVGAGLLCFVVGLAARQTLGSLIAGFVLMVSRPIGDWVRVAHEEAIITELTIFNTRLDTFDGEFVLLPTDEVNNSAITNRCKKGRLRIKLDLGATTRRTPTTPMTSPVRPSIASPSSSARPRPRSFRWPSGIRRSSWNSDSGLPGRGRPACGRPWPRSFRRSAAVEAEGIKIPFPQRDLIGRAQVGGCRVHGPSAESAEPAAERSSGNAKRASGDTRRSSGDAKRARMRSETDGPGDTVTEVPGRRGQRKVAPSPIRVW
ncbi:MAG: mechanosensitive ion channel domain-containing protein [Haloarculaceae archaeon]